jgi:hypothetical protein
MKLISFSYFSVNFLFIWTFITRIHVHSGINVRLMKQPGDRWVRLAAPGSFRMRRRSGDRVEDDQVSRNAPTLDSLLSMVLS